MKQFATSLQSSQILFSKKLFLTQIVVLIKGYRERSEACLAGKAGDLFGVHG
jgi:hypothetical protein